MIPVTATSAVPDPRTLPSRLRRTAYLQDCRPPRAGAEAAPDSRKRPNIDVVILAAPSGAVGTSSECLPAAVAAARTA
jgi:hypothetical protein